MGFLSYGSAKAASYTHDFQKDIDRLYQREAYASQVKAEKERKSMFYASLMKEQTAVAPNNTKRLEELYSGLHKEVADFAINNSDWETNPLKTQKMMSLMDQFINNPIIREDQEVQKEWNATKDAYNRGDIRQEEYESLAEKYNSYLEGSGEPYVFANPKRKDLTTIIKEANDWLQPHIGEITDPKTGKITKITKTPDEAIHLAAVMGLRDKDTDFVITRSYNSIPDTEKGLYRSKTEYFEMLLKAGEAMAVEDAGYDQMFALQEKSRLDNQNNLANYHRFYQNQVYEPLRTSGETSSDVANISFTEFGGVKQSLVMGPNGRNFKMYNQDGNQIEDVNIKGNVVSVGAGKIINIGGVPWVQTQIMVSLNDDQPALDASGNPIETPITEEEKAKNNKKKNDANKINQTERTLLAKTLDDHGFTISKVTDAGLLESMGLNGQTITSDVYTGTILMPADFSEGNRMKYDTYYGATKEGLSKGAELYNENYNIMEVLQSGNTSVASSIINSKQLKNISTNLGVSIDNLSWEQDENDPFTWYSKVNGKDVKYDFRENKTYIAK